MPFLRVTSLVGWINGLLLLDRPWGVPRFTSWFSLSTLISLGMLLLVVSLTTDMVINYSDFVDLTERNPLGRYIAKISSTHRWLFYFLTRFIFLINAKKMANVLTRLYYYPMKKGNVLNRNLKFFDCLLIALSYICAIVIAINATAILVKLLESRKNFMLNAFGVTGYGAIVAVLGILPMGLSDTIPFALVIAIIRAILRIFKEFCADLEAFLSKEQGILVQDSIIPSSTKSTLYSGSLLDLENEFKKFVHIKSPTGSTVFDEDTNLRRHVVCNPQTRDEVINKFYDMMDIFESAGKIISPFVFILLVVATVELVATVSAVVVIGHRGPFLINDILILIKVAVHLCLLQVGHRIKKTLEKGKNQVRKSFFQSSIRREMKDIVTALLGWDWKLSGLGFFDVDRRLAAGTISLLLSYVVIIFQLQLALSPTILADIHA